MNTSTFRKVIEYGIKEVWLKMGDGKNSSQILIGQFSNYRNKKTPYDHQFIDEIYTVQSWWHMTYEEEDDKNFIQDLALNKTSQRRV